MQRYMEEIIYQAKKDGITIKLRHAKVVFCGASKAGKTSFSRLLRNIPFDENYKSTEVGNATQVLISGKVNVQGTNWYDLDLQSEIEELRKHLISKTKMKPQIKNTPLSEPLSSSNNLQGQIQADLDVKSTDAGLETDTVSIRAEKNIPDYMPLVAAEKSLVSDIKKPDTLSPSKDLPEIWDTLTLLDTGGQPEFVNMLPAINASAAITFIVFNLLENLDKKVVAQSSVEGYIKHEMNYSNFYLLKCLLSSVKDSTTKKCHFPQTLFIKEDQYPDPAVCFIGTCYDKVQEPAVVKTINQRVRQLVNDINVERKFLQIWSDNERNILFPVDNTMAGNHQSEDSIAHKIRREFINKILLKKAQFEIPITWFILELQLRSWHEKEKKVCVSLDDVKEICDQIMPVGQKMEMKEIQEVLKFYHSLGMLLYFDEVKGINNFVITDPQWLFHNLTKVVSCTFDSRKFIDLTMLDALRNEGILHRQLLDDLDLDVQDVKLESFLNLLEHLKIIVPYKIDKYFMPSILPTCSLEDVDKILCEEEYGKPVFYHDETNCITVPPLLMKFRGDVIPRGLFNFLVIQLLQSKEPKFELYGVNKDDQIYRYSNLISFVTNTDTTYFLTLIDRNSCLEIQIRVNGNFKASNIHYDTQIAVSAALEVVCNQFGWRFSDVCYGFWCEYPKSQNKCNQLAVLSNSTSQNEYAKCLSHHQTNLENRHKVWFQVWYLCMVHSHTHTHTHTLHI